MVNFTDRVNTHLAPIRNRNSLGGFFHPTAITFNFGLHYAHHPGLNADVQYLDIIEALYQGIRSCTSAPVLWRNSAATQFHSAPLPLAWACRAPDRVRRLNDLSARWTYAKNISIADMWSLTTGRRDATHDNRHYQHDNVCATFGNIVLHQVCLTNRIVLRG